MCVYVCVCARVCECVLTSSVTEGDAISGNTQPGAPAAGQCRPVPSGGGSAWQQPPSRRPATAVPPQRPRGPVPSAHGRPQERHWPSEERTVSAGRNQEGVN